MQYKLLLADDSITIQKLVELMLVSEGFEVKSVSDGEQALEMLKNYSPDIILADIEMPLINGLQLCEKIKKSPDLRHIPFMLLVGAFEPFDEHYAKSIGIDDFIIKPFESSELIGKIKKIIKPVSLNEDSEKNTDMQATEIFAQPSESELKWDDDIPVVSEEKVDESDIGDEEIEAAMTKQVIEEIVESPIKEKYHIKNLEFTELFSKEELYRILKNSIDEKLTEIINKEDIVNTIHSYIKDSVEKLIINASQEIIKNVTEELIKNLHNFIQETINSEIKKLFPVIVTDIITREINKLISEIK